MQKYLYDFEKTAELNGWPREKWVTAIQPSLITKYKLFFMALSIHEILQETVPVKMTKNRIKR